MAQDMDHLEFRFAPPLQAHQFLPKNHGFLRFIRGLSLNLQLS